MALWTPSLIATALWLDASDTTSVLTASSAVIALRDKSGNGKHPAQSTATNRPSLVTGALNGLNVIRFDGTNDQLTFESTVSQANGQSVFAVVNTASLGTNYRVLLDRTSASGPAVYLGSVTNYTPVIYWGTGDSASWSAPIQRAALMRWHMATGTSNCSVTVDGGTPSTGTTDGTVFSTWNKLSNATVQQSAFDLAELIIVNSPSAATVALIEGYLSWKWGLEANLPAGHAYETVAPAEPYTVAGNFTESSTISNWTVSLSLMADNTSIDNAIFTGTAYSLTAPSIAPCKVTISPRVDYAWSANKVSITGDFMSPSNPDATPYQFEVTTGGDFGATEPTYNTTVGNTTTAGAATLTCRGALVDPLTIGPKIPA